MPSRGVDEIVGQLESVFEECVDDQPARKLYESAGEDTFAPSQGAASISLEDFRGLDATSMFGLDANIEEVYWPPEIEGEEPPPEVLPVNPGVPEIMPGIDHWSRSTVISHWSKQEYYKACEGLAIMFHPKLLAVKPTGHDVLYWLRAHQLYESDGTQNFQITACPPFR